MFQDQREKYDMFLDVMKDFKAQRFGYYHFNKNSMFQMIENAWLTHAMIWVLQD